MSCRRSLKGDHLRDTTMGLVVETVGMMMVAGAAGAAVVTVVVLIEAVAAAVIGGEGGGKVRLCICFSEIPHSAGVTGCYFHGRSIKCTFSAFVFVLLITDAIHQDKESRFFCFYFLL